VTDSPPRTVAERRPRRPDRNRNRGAGAFLRDLVVIVVVAVVASFLIKTFLVRSFYIPSESMENTLLVNDRILVDELVPGVIPLQRGDVVVFKDPGGWLESTVAPPQGAIATAADQLLSLVGLSAQDANDHLIKRVIGLPGDHVKCCNALGQISVNGVPIDETSYVKLQPGQSAPQPVPFNVVVPKDSLWVLGDNREHSGDSSWNFLKKGGDAGFVPTKNVVGHVVGVVSWLRADHPAGS